MWTHIGGHRVIPFLLYSYNSFVVPEKKYASTNPIFRDFGPCGPFLTLLCLRGPEQTHRHRQNVKNAGHWYGQDGFESCLGCTITTIGAYTRGFIFIPLAYERDSESPGESVQNWSASKLQGDRIRNFRTAPRSSTRCQIARKGAFGFRFSDSWRSCDHGFSVSSSVTAVALHKSY